MLNNEMTANSLSVFSIDVIFIVTVCVCDYKAL